MLGRWDSLFCRKKIADVLDNVDFNQLQDAVKDAEAESTWERLNEGSNEAKSKEEVWLKNFDMTDLDVPLSGICKYVEVLAVNEVQIKLTGKCLLQTMLFGQDIALKSVRNDSSKADQYDGKCFG